MSDDRRRRIEKCLRRIMEGADGDRCSQCRQVFCAAGNPVVTFGGVTKQRRVALVGACCLNELTEVFTTGIFIPGEPVWKKDDADWFKHHPQRSHRLRLALSGEIERWSIPPALLGTHDHYVVVRQIQSGVRARLPSLWSKGSTLPDSEEFAHALFDFLDGGSPAPEFSKFTRGDIETLARGYQT